MPLDTQHLAGLSGAHSSPAPAPRPAPPGALTRVLHRLDWRARRRVRVAVWAWAVARKAEGINGPGG